MPTIAELNQLLFQDFALENSKRIPLTVLEEYNYGERQGRIVTAPMRAEVEGGSPAEPEPEPPEPCPEVVLVCDSISASKSLWCVFAEFGTPSSPPKWYRTKTTIYSKHCSNGAGGGFCSSARDNTTIETADDPYDPCGFTTTCSGSGSLQYG